MRYYTPLTLSFSEIEKGDWSMSLVFPEKPPCPKGAVIVLSAHSVKGLSNVDLSLETSSSFSPFVTQIKGGL